MSMSQQSPINLQNPVFADLGAEGLDRQWTGSVAGLVVQEKEGVKVQVLTDQPQEIELGGRKYRLVSFHFHHPSEHWRDGKPYSMELHLVHRSVDTATHYAVIGIFIEMADETDDTKVEAFLKDVAEVLKMPKELRYKHMVKVDPKIFLPKEPGDYYRYEGSLTTPDFSENVSWVVFKNPLIVSQNELLGLILEFEKPARDPQPLNRRFILATFRENGSADSATQGPSSPTSKPPGKRVGGRSGQSKRSRDQS